jgi:two-component system sensor histidine kinase TctE
VARIVDELLGNALQYARTRVHVDLRRDGDEALLSVSDDGPGVPESEREAIFERFRRGTSSVPGGSGLGLALVRESVQAVGGDATTVESPWGGLTVRVWIPLVAHYAGSSRPIPE